jgi:hypothetical protein
MKQAGMIYQWWQKTGQALRGWPLDARSPLFYVPDSIAGLADEVLSADLLSGSVEAAH